MGAVEYRSGTGHGCEPRNPIQSRVSGLDGVVHLLNLDHRVGRHKAAWFIARGFQADFDKPLTAELFRYGRSSHLVRDYETEHGHRYVY